VRWAVFTIWLVLAGCASATPPASSGRPRSDGVPELGLQTKAAEQRVEPEPAAKISGDGPDASDGRQQDLADAAPGVAPDPAAVEGEVFAHCAYGPPKYGEDPRTDSMENFAVLVLDTPLPKVCPSGPGAECVPDVAMFHVSTPPAGGAARPESLVGRHVRVSVSEYQTAETGHHHSRMVLWYTDVEDLGRALQPSLRTTWSSAKRDFLGISCKGFPR
jgi:hypothetical protein